MGAFITYYALTLRSHAPTYLLETLVELAEDVGLVEHLAVVAVLVVVGDALSQRAWQLAVRHVFLHLLELNKQHQYSDVLRPQ